MVLQRHWERFADPISESEKFGHCAQSESEDLAGKEEKVSSGQTEQFDAPVIFLNVPGGHAEQKLSSVGKYVSLTRCKLVFVWG